MELIPQGTILLPNWVTEKGFTFGTIDDPDLATLFDAEFVLRGDLWWVNAVGMIFGTMIVPAEFTVSIGDTNPTEAKDGSDDGWAASDLNRVTFPTGGDEHYLTVPKPGIYEVNWSLSLHKDAGPATAIHGGIMVDGTAQRDNGEAHEDLASTDVSGCLASPGTVDCPNGTEQISLWVSNDQSNDVHIDHGTVVIKQIGGT
jgi:hypothetical protein